MALDRTITLNDVEMEVSVEYTYTPPERCSYGNSYSTSEPGDPAEVDIIGVINKETGENVQENLSQKQLDSLEEAVFEHEGGREQGDD